MLRLSLADTILGRPLASDEEDQRRLGVAAGIPVFGLDALSSAAYGPEAALTVLYDRRVAVARQPASPASMASVTVAGEAGRPNEDASGLRSGKNRTGGSRRD